MTVSQVQTICFPWAQLTGETPALSRHLTAAALSLGGVEGFGDGAFTRIEFGETEALSGICQEKKSLHTSVLSCKIKAGFFK